MLFAHLRRCRLAAVLCKVSAAGVDLGTVLSGRVCTVLHKADVCSGRGQYSTL